MFKIRFFPLAILVVFALTTIMGGGCDLANAENELDTGDKIVPVWSDTDDNTTISGIYIDHCETFSDLFDWSEVIVTGTFVSRKERNSLVNAYQFKIESVLYGSIDAESITIYQMKDPIYNIFNSNRTFLLFLAKFKNLEDSAFYIVGGGGRSGIFYNNKGQIDGLDKDILNSAQSTLGSGTFYALKEYIANMMLDEE